MVLKIIKNNKIKSNQRHFEKFLEKYHDNSKQFTIDCEAINVDYFNSESIVTIRHRKPSKESIYYTSILKDRNEYAYFFGLARDPVISTSSYMDMGVQIVPKLVAILNADDSSISSIVFAEDSDEFNNVILLKIDCSMLSDLELSVLKNKNKLTKLKNGKGFIKFGAIGDFNTLKNIRNFISNVDFEYDNEIYVKINRVSIPAGSKNLKPDYDIIRDRFYNFNNNYSELEEIVDMNLEDDKQVLINSYDDVVDGFGLEGDFGSNFSLDSSSDSVVDGFGLDAGLDSYSDMDLYKNFLIEDYEIYLEMSILKDEFFKIMRLLDNLVESYTNLNNIEVLDLAYGLLSITVSILVSYDNDIKIIEDILLNNGFVPL